MRLFVSPALCIPRHLTREESPDEVREYVYDARERLIRVEDGNGATIVRYGYNPFGHRVWKEVNGTRTYFFYNESGLVGEYDANGNLIREYHYKPSHTWMTRPLFMRSDNQVYYYHNDHLGTPQKLINRGGQVVWEADYEAFGKANITTEEVANPLRFPGQYYDAETGLHHNFHRDYFPDIGRYIQSDPIGLNGGINSYRYAHNNPVAFIDPLGLITWNCTTFSAEAGISAAGAGKSWFTCMSPCQGGVRVIARMEINFGGAGKTVGRGGIALLGSHNVELTADTNTIDASVFEGEFFEFGAGGGWGIGYSVSFVSFGQGRVKGFNHDFSGAIGMSAGERSGTSTVVSQETEQCDACYD